jgi:4-hydroxy-4-methyl-2-oxoglutarate aldolase
MAHEIIERFKAVAVASVSDAVDDVVGEPRFMSSAIRPRTGQKLVGRAVTVLERPSGQSGPPIHALRALDRADPGSVIVIGVEAPDTQKEVAVWGGLMSTAAAERGLSGAVLDAGTRDVAETREMGFTVYARHVSPATTVGRVATVAADIPVMCGGILVEPSDLLVGDEDGIVVVPEGRLSEVIDVAEEMERNEDHMEEMIRKKGSIIGAFEELGRI